MLTQRQAEILGWAARGYSNGQIAAVLGLRESTIKNTMSSIYGRLAAPDRAAAVVLAIGLGEIALPDPTQVVRLERC